MMEVWRGAMGSLWYASAAVPKMELMPTARAVTRKKDGISTSNGMYRRRKTRSDGDMIAEK